MLAELAGWVALAATGHFVEPAGVAASAKAVDFEHTVVLAGLAELVVLAASVHFVEPVGMGGIAELPANDKSVESSKQNIQRFFHELTLLCVLYILYDLRGRLGVELLVLLRRLRSSMGRLSRMRRDLRLHTIAPWDCFALQSLRDCS